MTSRLILDHGLSSSVAGYTEHTLPEYVSLVPRVRDKFKKKKQTGGDNTGLGPKPVPLPPLSDLLDTQDTQDQPPPPTCHTPPEINTSHHVLVAPNYDWSLMDGHEKEMHKLQCTHMRDNFLKHIVKCNVMIVLTGAFHRTVDTHDKRQHTINRLHALRHVPRAAIHQIKELLGDDNVESIHLTHFMDVEAETFGPEYLMDLGVNSWESIREFNTLWKSGSDKIVGMTQYLETTNPGEKVKVFNVNCKTNKCEEVCAYIEVNNINVIMLVGKHAQWLNRQLHLVGFPDILDKFNIRLVCGPAGATVLGSTTWTDLFLRYNAFSDRGAEDDYYTEAGVIGFLDDIPADDNSIVCPRITNVCTTGMEVIQNVSLLPGFQDYAYNIFEAAPEDTMPFCDKLAVSDSMMLHIAPRTGATFYCAHELVNVVWNRGRVIDPLDYLNLRDVNTIRLYHFPPIGEIGEIDSRPDQKFANTFSAMRYIKETNILVNLGAVNRGGSGRPSPGNVFAMLGLIAMTFFAALVPRDNTSPK
jgi:hypothetical protein